MRFNPLNKLFGAFSHDIGIDLGTANTLVWVRGKGVVIREPSAVARNKKTKEILAIGSSAKKMLGRAPATIETIRPLKDGVIADFDATAAMLSFYIKKVHESGGGIPKSIKLATSEIREALAPVVQEIIGNIVDTLEETPPELVSDIMERGIVMAGGGSLLPGVDKMVSEATKMPVWIAG